MDPIDRAILDLLTAAGRTTVTELADAVRLGASATRDRLRRLERDGLLTGYVATVDPERLGFPVEALVDVDVPAEVESFEAVLESTPAVVEALHATGESDYVVRVRCRSTAELDSVVRDLKRRHGATRTRTRVVLAQTVAPRARLS
jgi:Lrp/AsnC family transcriptional regulator, leucine-responsive regulatory protein